MKKTMLFILLITFSSLAYAGAVPVGGMGMGSGMVGGGFTPMPSRDSGGEPSGGDPSGGDPADGEPSGGDPADGESSGDNDRYFGTGDY